MPARTGERRQLIESIPRRRRKIEMPNWGIPVSYAVIAVVVAHYAAEN